MSNKTDKPCTVSQNGIVYEEPRYTMQKIGFYDNWENKLIDAKDLIIGHECTWIMPERYVEKIVNNSV